MLFARNLGILALIALVLTVVPGGAEATDTVLTALSMVFLASLAYFIWRAHKENAMTLDSLTESWRAVHWGALGMLAFLVAGSDEMFGTGAATLAWIGLFVLSIFALVRVFQESRTY